MIRDALDLFEQRVQESVSAKDKVQFLDVPGRPTEYAVVKTDGTVEYQHRDPPVRRHRFNTLDGFENFVNWAKDALSAVPTLWVSGGTVQAVLNDDAHGYRRDVAILEIAESNEWKKLNWFAGNWMQQKELVRALRIDMHEALTESSEMLLKTAKVIGAKSSSTAHGKVETGRESMGFDIEAEVRSDAGSIPETVVFHVRRFCDPETTMTQDVECIVDIEAKQVLFNIEPLPSSLDDAANAFESSIIERLANIAPTFSGTPYANGVSL